jgi:hypothetical protein
MFSPVSPKNNIRIRTNIKSITGLEGDQATGKRLRFPPARKHEADPVTA